MTDLTFSQLTTLRLLSEGKSPGEIAEVMHYTLKEVENEIARIIGAMDAGSAAEAVILARSRRLIGPFS